MKPPLMPLAASLGLLALAACGGKSADQAVVADAVATSAAVGDTLVVDTVSSEVGWTGRKVTGKHDGSFGSYDGYLIVDTTGVKAVRLHFDTRTITSDTERLTTHLKSADFFDVENYPTMRFVSTSFDGEQLTGDLTIKDVTKPVTFEVEFNGEQADPWGNTKAGFEAEAEVKRADWGLTWNAAIEGGGVLVSDKIKIVLDVQLLKQA